MNKISLKNALKNALLAQFREESISDPASYEPKTDQSRLTSWAKNFRSKKQEPFLDLRETARKI